MTTPIGHAGIFCGDFPDAPVFEKAILTWIKEMANSGLIITDTELRVLCWNRWMEQHTGQTRDETALRPLLEIFPNIAERGRDRFFHMALEGQPSVLSYGIHHHLIPMPSDDGEKGDLMPQAVRIYPLEHGDRVIGTLTRIEDVSQRVRREREMQTTIDELQQALKQLKTLSGMLPICANCKKIRDDKGYWSQVESYISAHTDVLFSHSICPECAKKLYPEYYEAMYPDEKVKKEE